MWAQGHSGARCAEGRAMTIEDPDPLEEWRRAKNWKLTREEQIYDRAYRTAWHAAGRLVPDHEAREIAEPVARAKAAGKKPSSAFKGRQAQNPAAAAAVQAVEE